MSQHVNKGNSATEWPFAWPGTFDRLPFEQLSRAGGGFGEAWIAWQQELSRFVIARLQADGELWQKLLGSKDWADAAKVQQDWIAATFAHYSHEAKRLAEIAWAGAAAAPAASVAPPQADGSRAAAE